MENPAVKKYFYLALALLGLWAGVRYALPLIFPFALGLGIALGAEPLVTLCQRRFPRWVGSALGVTATLILALCALTLLLSTALRELGQLAGALPDMAQTARQGLTSLEDFLLSLARRAPEGLQGVLQRWVLSLFHDSGRWSDAMAEHLPGIASSLLGRIPNSALTLFTVVISSYMLSARLPQLRKALRERIPQSWQDKALPTLRKLRHCLGRYLAAQARLCAISFAIMCLGLLVLGIPYAPVWALAIALIDALPVLGSGTVLVPWALICFLQDNSPQALGLLVIYILVTVARSVLEPRLLGKQLGLDPLLTLVAMYAGFRLWGVLGMVFSPMVAALTGELVKSQE